MAFYSSWWFFFHPRYLQIFFSSSIFSDCIILVPRLPSFITSSHFYYFFFIILSLTFDFIKHPGFDIGPGFLGPLRYFSFHNFHLEHESFEHYSRYSIFYPKLIKPNYLSWFRNLHLHFFVDWLDFSVAFSFVIFLIFWFFFAFYFSSVLVISGEPLTSNLAYNRN